MNETIAKIIESLFATKWALVASPPAVKYRNVSFIQPANGEWVTLTILPGSSTQASIGAEKVERQLGVVIFQIFTPKNIGDRRAKAISDLIAGIFRFNQCALMADGAVNQLENGTVIQVVKAGALLTEAEEILETEDEEILETESADVTPVLTIQFRSPEPFDVGERRDYYQLNLRVPYQADKLFT